MALSLEKQVIFPLRLSVPYGAVASGGSTRAYFRHTATTGGTVFTGDSWGREVQQEWPSPQAQARHPEELSTQSIPKSRTGQNPPWPLSLALPLLPLALQPLPAQCQPFLPPLLTPLLVLLSRKKKKMFLLDQKGTRERSPRSQCRGGPARGLEKTEGRAGCAWRGRHSAPRPLPATQDLGTCWPEHGGRA